jgi:hypothetical protein
MHIILLLASFSSSCFCESFLNGIMCLFYLQMIHYESKYNWIAFLSLRTCISLLMIFTIYIPLLFPLLTLFLTNMQSLAFLVIVL